MTATNVTIKVIPTLDADIERVMRLRIEQAGDTLSLLNLLFDFGCYHADFAVPKEEYTKANRRGESGSFAPLTEVIFINAASIMVPVYSAVALWDPFSDQRIYAIVIAPGNNILVHDRTNKSDKATLTVTSKMNAQRILGMNHCWTEGFVYDLVQCANLFGFDFHKQLNKVCLPQSRRHNWFKTNMVQLLQIQPLAEVV